MFILNKHDPNYIDQDMDDEGSEEYSDEEDVSWKCRRASALLVTALLESGWDCAAVLPTLVARMSEREEGVRLVVFDAVSTGITRGAPYV